MLRRSGDDDSAAKPAAQGGAVARDDEAAAQAAEAARYVDDDSAAKPAAQGDGAASDDEAEAQAVEAASSAPEVISDRSGLTVRIRWRLSGITETKHLHRACTVKMIKKILERQLDEAAGRKSRVRLFLGPQELLDVQTVAALEPAGDPVFEAVAENGLLCDCNREENEDACIVCSFCGFATCDNCPSYDDDERFCHHCELKDMVYECFRCYGSNRMYWHYCSRCGAVVCDHCYNTNRVCPD